MFARAPKRSLPLDVYRQSLSCLEALQLPFLCPALFRQSTSSSKSSSSSSSKAWVPSRWESNCSRKGASNQRPPNRFPQRRNLASAVTAEETAQHDAHIPWEGPVPTDYGYRQAFDGQSIGPLPGFDPGSSPLVINDSLATHPKKFRTSGKAVSGTINEIHQTLHACLQVGRLERAAALVRRLNDLYKPDAPGLLAAHNEYISELSRRIVQHKDQQLLQQLQQWFQVDLVDAGVEADATTYVLMILASLQRDDARRDRTVRRYVNLGKEAGISPEIEALLSLHHDVDLNAFLEHSPSKNEALMSDIENEPAGTTTIADQSPERVDEVREVKQKGSGLSTLKKSLSIFSDHSSIKPSERMSPTERQRLIEADTVNAAIERWRDEDAQLRSIGVNSGLSTSSVGAILWKWHEKLVPLLKDDLRMSQEVEKIEKRNKSEETLLLIGPYIQSLSPEKLSAMTALMALKVSSTDPLDEKGVRIHNIVEGIGKAIQNEGIVEAMRKTKDKKWRGLTNITDARLRQGYLSKLLHNSASRDWDKMNWDVSTVMKVGAFLLSRLMEVAWVDVSKKDPKTGLEVHEVRPVFHHAFQYIAGKRVGVIRLNSSIREHLTKTPVASALAKYLPMVCEPKPWTGYAEGGFLEYPEPVVRLRTGSSQPKQYAVTAAENGDMAHVFKGLDVLAKTPWSINRFVFNTMLEAWNSGQAIAKIPPENPSSDLPPEPASSGNPLERSKWLKQVREIENHISGLKSQRCFQNFQLEVARAYLNETFYFPHNCDFRGRAYPMTPFLNHMGADNVRGLLMFAQGKKLTADGLWWLKVHLANVYGYDKASFAERLNFTEAHLTEITDSVERPLSGQKWWLEAEDPWQCLAACKELKNALESPEPTEYVCKLAIHQDGTCNGLQHYAALGGDVVGAQQVNLEPGDRPSDIYTGVAELVKAEIREDAAQGNELAKALDGKVTRKVVKQTVMTNVYGVTFIGAKRQVRKQLDDLLTDFPNTREVNLILASLYIARKIFVALAKMFNGAHDIQYWLLDCARRISESLAPEQVAYIVGAATDEEAATDEASRSLFKRKPVNKTSLKEMTDFKTSVIWTTPLKMPVVQPYRKKSAKRVDTSLQKITIMDRSVANPIDKVKQLQAFPPNFIHSLDATHMYLTALKCDEAGLTFAAIHDSFWTHAGDVHAMNGIIREAFIRMHSEDIISRLAAEFNARYNGYVRFAYVRSDTSIGQKILAWRKERAMRSETGRYRKATASNDLGSRKWQELILERHRLDLLKSENPKEREEGEQMNTPGKIFLEEADEKSLAPLDVKTATIGLSPSSRDAKLKSDQRLDVGNMDNADPLGSTDDEDAAAISEQDSDSREDLNPAEEAEDRPAYNEEGGGETSNKLGLSKSKKVWIWLPLTFPPVPKKGNFDVNRLKESPYFFS